jgi:hypothetical protein
MEKIVDLNAYRTRTLERRCFSAWHKRFAEKFSAETRLCDLSDRTVYRLALPGDDSSTAFYELIMGVLDIGPAAKFNYLADDDKMRVVDVHLFAADQVRFEMMRRLGWLTAFATQHHGLMDLVHAFDQAKTLSRDKIPELSPTHPQYDAYKILVDRDKEAFVRRLLPAALEAFKLRL